MKKFGIIAILFVLSFALYAEVGESDLYYVNVKVVRAFMHNKGYYVIYKTSMKDMAEVFIPYSWFKPGDNRAKLKNASGRIDPYLSLYSKNGQFHHINVVLPIENPSDLVWGTLRSPKDYDDKFNVETVEFKY